jgi:hypothetical protein
VRWFQARSLLEQGAIDCGSEGGPAVLQIRSSYFGGLVLGDYNESDSEIWRVHSHTSPLHGVKILESLAL